jgi:hypothetical protein
MIPMGYSGILGKLILEKNLKSKISCKNRFKLLKNTFCHKLFIFFLGLLNFILWPWKVATLPGLMTSTSLGWHILSVSHS